MSNKVVATKTVDPHGAPPGSAAPQVQRSPEQGADQPSGGLRRVVEADIEADIVAIVVREDQVGVQRRVDGETMPKTIRPPMIEMVGETSTGTAIAMPADTPASSNAHFRAKATLAEMAAPAGLV